MERSEENGEGSEEEMKKTVTFNFPDDFKFPEYYGQENVKYKISLTQTTPFYRSACDICPFEEIMFDEIHDDYTHGCGLTGDTKYTIQANRRECPFFRGQENVEY